MIEIDLYNRLKNDSAIAALVSTRIYPKRAPQSVVSPYIIYNVINGNNKQCLAGEIFETETRFQLDCWSTSYSTIKGLKQAVKNSIIGFKSSHSISTSDDYEPDTQLYREIIDFKLKG